MTCSAKLLVFFTLFKILLVSTQDDNFTFLITGGYRPRKHTLVKHIVSLRYDEYNECFGCKHFCGGSILSPRLILTAAHCVWNRHTGKTKDINLIQIVASTPNRVEQNRQTKIIDVEAIIVHQDFELKTLFNDVALVYLTTDIYEDDLYAQRIKLTDGPPKQNTTCTALGWGKIFEKGPLAADAVYVDIYILTAKTCKKVFNGFRDGMLCAGNMRDLEKDVCNGDSGGPLICDGKVTGVVSFGSGCGIKPGVYTDVWYYRKWIMAGGKSVENGKSRITIKLLNILFLTLLVWIVS